MPLRTFNRKNVKPLTINEAHVVGFNGEEYSYGLDEVVPTNMIILSNEEWYIFLITYDILNKHIYDFYGDRHIFDSILCNYPSWSYSDYGTFNTDIHNRVRNVLLKNREKYAKLYEAMIVEFNPLWNVDGVEEIVRTLERDGTITNAKSGNDALEKRGTVGNVASGTDKTTYSGKEINTKDGGLTNAKTGGYSDTKSVTTTDSNAWEDSEKNTRTYPQGGEVEKTTYDSITDTKTFAEREDALVHGKSETTTYNNTDTTKYNSSNTETLDTIDTERTTHERHGNIGVTTTTKLLTEYVDYAQYFDFVDIVARDCIESFTMGVY